MLTIDQLLEQHDSYDLGDGISLSRREARRWFVYVNSTEVMFRAYGDLPPQRFGTVREAMIWLETSKGIAAVERARFNDAAHTIGKAVSP